MPRKALSFLFALAVATGAFLAHAETVGEDVARAAAEGFLSKSSVAKTILSGRSVDSVEAYGSLWIARLAPSGYIEVAGSTKCAPILSFSENDFTEPEADSPLAAKLSSDTLMVEAKEADEDAADNADWTKYTAPVAKKRTLLAAKPTGTDGTGYDHFVAPLLGATWNQTAPFNDLSPYNYFCGCMATAAGQELRYWRWPYRYEKFRQTTHGVRDAQFNYSDFVLRPNGLVPFNWDKVVASAPNPASTPWAADKEATYNTAWLSLWAQSLTGMGYKPGGSGGTRQLAGTAEEYWYEKGKGMTYWSDGYENLWAAIKADLDWGSPIQINTAAHQMVIDGYAVENYGEEDEVDWINLNLGYGNAVYWDNLKTAVTEGSYSGTLASFQTGFRPQKIVQFEPVPKVSTSEITLTWHMAPCYTNRTSGFTLEIAKAGGAKSNVQIPTHGEKTTYTASDLEMGGEYTFSVCPVMVDGEGTGRTNSVTTTIGEPKAAPEFLSASSVACGIELLQQDIFIECAYGIVNKIDLTCSESTTEVVPYSSHLTILPDSQLSVTKNGNVFTVNVDATAMDPKWSGEMLVLTLVAKNDDDTEAYKNLMLRFNSMRQVINGTFDAADGDSDSAVWFCGDTTIDAKGKTVSFGASAFQGTGKVTLTDSVGGGSFTFASLDNFKGTLVFTGNCSVTLPEDMSKFEGTLSITSGTYTLSNDLPASVSVAIANGVTLNLDNANVASTITGAGTISITSGSSVLSGAVTSGVTLSGGELTIPAGTGDYSTVSVGGGTLKIQLSQAQSILGYDWWLPLYTSGAVKFVLYDGTVVDATTTAATPGITIAHASDANVWSGTDYATFGEYYSAKWSNGLPNEGDYVIFKSELNDWMETGTDEGTMMALNLTSPRNLGYVLVKGTDKLEIGVYSGATSALLSTDVLENEVETHITTTYFQPKTVIPHRTLSTSSGFILSCELDSTYASYLKKHETGGSSLPDANYWQGTVVFCNKNVSSLELPNYGNVQSKIRFNGVTGSLMGNKIYDGTLELVDYDESPALNINSGSSNNGLTIGSVTGTGMFKTSGSATALNILLKDISGWTGSFDLASKTIAIGQSIPSSYTGNDGRLHICQAATVADGATWKADGGLYLGAGGALTVNGAVEVKNVTTYGEGASITLEDGAVLQVSAASASDSVPTLNFKAGTFRVKEGSDAFRETATINFCAASGKRTVIDANGATLTLGPNVFSGSGDVCLTSSKEGGKIIVEGVSADYSGTIFCDISCEVSLGDLSKATNCTIDVSDIIISRSSSDIGNLTIGSGASLEVTVNKQSLIDGCTIDTVTLVDGGTMVLKDKTGQEITTFTASDAVDGKYVLEPDPDVTVECLLDYEFNGNMNSTGTDTTGLTIWNGTASYDSESQKIKMNCKPYINKTFAMPDDEWSTFIRCTLPAANGESPTMVLMFGKNGGSVFGLVAGAGENTVALASKDGLIGEAVQVDDATTTQHVYAIVKTANRVRLYVDGVLKVDESATVSVSKEFQIGSVKNGNNTSYSPCEDANALIDYLKFYDFAVGDNFEEMVYSGPKPVAVWDGDFSPSELTKFSGYELVDWNETHGENNSSVTIDRANQGLMFRSSTGLSGMTVLVRYSNLQAGTTNKRVLFTSTINSNYTGTRAGIRLASGSAGTLRGLSGNTDWDDSKNLESGSVNESGVMAFTYSNAGTYLYKGSSLDDMAEAWGCSSLKWAGDFNNSTVYGAGIGGYCEGVSATGYEAAQGMTITAIAVFNSAVSVSDLKDYSWPSEASEEPEEPEPTLTVSPASGAVAAGTKMTVTCSDRTATIWYKKFVTGDEEYVEYTEPVVLETGINYYYVKVNDGEATMYTYIVAAPEPEYEGPAPIAVWVAGEFDDDKSAHGGLEFALNGNTTNALGQVVIGDSTTLGATVAVPSGTLPRMTMLVKYSVPAGGAPVAQSVPASLFSTYDMGALAGAGSSALAGYWLNGSTVSTGNYAFSDPAQTMPQEGYVLISNWTTTPNSGDHGTAVYSGETLSELVGGEVTGLRFTGADKSITGIGVGGPTVAGTKPWAGMVVESVALFDEWVATNVIANYKFPAQGAVQPEDSDRYVVEPVASWVNDFKTTEKGDCTLSVSGTTAVKDDEFGGVLTVGDSAAVIDVSGTANGGSVTVLVKYRATSATVNAPVVTFGETLSNSVRIDVGAYTQSARTLAVNRSYNGGNNKWVALNTAASLNEGEGYLLCARKTNDMLVYVGDSLDNMTGGSTAAPGDISYSCDLIQAIGIGGPSGLPNADATWSAFDGFVVEKIVVFNGYYTPDQVRYIPNPEDGDTVNIADNTTWTFTASDTPREYTSVGTLSSSGTIAIANASELTEGTYPLATWSTPQQYTTQCAGYGKVGTLVTEGLAEGLSARLVYGARGIYLRVDDTAKQAARKPLVVWCYGDSITEGFNAQATGANYRILLYQKLEMLGYNVRSTGVYGLSNGYNSVDPTGTPLTDQYKWHSAKHGATAGPSSLAHRSNLSENVDTLAIQAGTPDVALLLIGVNDLPQFSTVEPVFAAWTNVVTRLVNNLPDTKIIVSTVLYSDGTRTDIDPKITNLNTNYIKPIMATQPEEWQGHVFLADLNSYVKSGDTGIIYSDHLHPDWWGYDQMADGYLDKIVECYPDPDATDFPSQNPIPAAPTSDQLGAANKPELADYRAGFSKLCNIRVEKGQDVSNVVYDDVNGEAASENLEKVGYFVEFVRDDNHAHKWVWVDMDAFGDADLASVGLPQRNYQQAVTRMHVCSNHGAIDNVAADDDSVTGWIEFSPYDYTRTASNSAAPANYGEPFDWNDTLSESGSYGCMQVFRVMNPSSRDLYERPQLMFAFNNFQSQNSNPADFGIGNFAQHFNCNNSYHTEDWTGVGGTLAKMAPDQYSVKAIEIWTKEAAYAGPEPAAVWVAGEFDDDRSAHGGCEFALNGNTTNAVGEIVIGNSTTLGATIAVPNYDNATMLVKYEIPSGGAPAANSVPASVFVTKEMGALAGSGSSDLGGYWLNGSNVTTGYAFSSPAPSIPQQGYLLISVPANSNQNPGNHYTATYVGETVTALSGGETSGLRFTGDNNRVTSIGVGGPTVAGAVPWAGMVIKGVALFDDWLTPDDIRGYKFPEQGAVQPEDSDRYNIEPVASWVNDFKTTETNGCTLSVSGTTAAKDDAFGGTLTIGDSAAVIDVSGTANGGSVTVLVKYRATSATVNAPVVTFGETLSNSVRIDVGAYTQSARTLAVNRSYNGGNNKWVALNTAASLNEGEGYLLCARKTNDMLVYVGNSLDNMAGGSTAAPGDISYSCNLIQAIGIGGPSGLPNADATWSAFDGFVVEKIVVFNGYYTPDQIRFIPIPEDSDTVNIADNATWRFAATATPREYTNIGTLSSSGTIAITNAAELTEGTYPLATWTTAQKKSTGYGRVGTLDATGLPAGLSAELVYGAKAIYLRVWNPTTQAEKGTIKVWPYGDSITEGFNAGGTRANYRVLLAQKLSMLGYNVEMVGCYDKINGANGIDPSGQVIPDAWKWHSAKHGATAGPTTSAAGRANLCENVDTLCAQAGNPDVVLLLAGANDIVPATGRSAQQVVSSITNIVAHIAMNLPDTKIVVGNQINVEQGYNSGNYTHVTNMIPQVNTLLKNYVDDLPEALVGKVFLADLNSYVKSGEYGILFDHGSDHLHPDWWGHDQMAEGWLSVVTNQFTSTQTFPSATIPAAPTADELGAAAKSELAEYRKGYQLCRRIDAASNLNVASPYAVVGEGAAERIGKVAYFVEYVRADNNAHKWVWIDMDAFGTTIGDVGLPTNNHQQVVTNLHVKSNHNGIENVAADDDTVTGFVEFSPYDYNGNASGVTGAPAGNGSCCDWNDTLSESGSYSCMQVHRVFSPAKAAPDGITRGGQVLFAYNNWQSSSSTAEFGIGNFSSHFYRGANDAQTLDYTYTANAPKMNADAYSVKRIEIWTKAFPVIDSGAEITLVAVPRACKADGLIDTENRYEGDVLLAYDSTEDQYFSWELDEDKVWQIAQTIKTGNDANTPEAGAYDLTAGQAVWVKRTVESLNAPIRLLVSYVAGETSIDIKSGTSEAVTWNLVAYPAGELKLNDEKLKLKDSASTSDTILVPTAGAPLNYTFKDGKWGREKLVKGDDGIYRTERKEEDEDTTIPAGKGFWYINGSEKDSITL